MMFARRNGPDSKARPIRQVRRPARARGPGLAVELCEERVMLSTTLLSVNAAGTAAGNDVSGFTNSDEGMPGLPNQTGSLQTNLSADGTKMVFTSEATNLVPGMTGTSGVSNVFVRDLATGQTSLVSPTPTGQAGSLTYLDPVISPNGQYVAFLSEPFNVSAVPTSSTGPSLPADQEDLYVRDLATGTTTLLDQTPAGAASDGNSTGQFVFSPNSQYLAFVDTSANLTNAPVDPNDTNPNTILSQLEGTTPQPDYVYVRDLAAQTTSLVSVAMDGDAAGDFSASMGGVPGQLAFSPDSQSILFSSSASDLTSNPVSTAPNPLQNLVIPSNLFLRNLATGTTTLVSADPDGSLGTGTSTTAVFSPNGQDIAFVSNSPGETRNAPDSSSSSTASDGWLFAANVYLRNLTTGTTTLVSATPAGDSSNGYAASPIFSPDGNSLAYLSSATDLTDNTPDPSSPPGNGYDQEPSAQNVFLTNLSDGTTTLESVTPSGLSSSGYATSLAFSPNGQELAFTSNASDLTNNPVQKFVSPMSGSTGSASGSGSGSNGPGLSNVFVRNLATGTTTLASVTTSGLLAQADSGDMFFSPDSGTLYFTSGAIDLTNNAPDTSTPGSLTGGYLANNLFATNLATGTTTLLTATPSGLLSDASGVGAFLSPDGQTIYVDSDASDLVAGQTQSGSEIYAITPPVATPNQIAFQSWETQALESDGQAVVTIDRSGPATSAASVDYAVLAGTAQAGTDYAATSGILSFAPGQTSASFDVPLTGDTFSGVRSATLALSNPQGGSLGVASATLELASTESAFATSPGSVSTPTSTTPINQFPATTGAGTTSTQPTMPAAPTPTPATPAPAPKPASPAPTPTSSSPTPTPTPTPTPAPGPAVTTATFQKTGKHSTGLVIAFNQPLSATAAEDVSNYQVNHVVHRSHGGHDVSVRLGRQVAIRSASYNATTHQVTLSFKGKLRPGAMIRLAIRGTSGGLMGTDGTALNSTGATSPGQDTVVPLTLS